MCLRIHQAGCVKRCHAKMMLGGVPYCRLCGTGSPRFLESGLLDLNHRKKVLFLHHLPFPDPPPCRLIQVDLIFGSMVFPRRSYTARLCYPGASLIVWVCSIQTLLCGAVRLLFSDYKNALAITSVESMFWLHVPPDMSYTRPHTNSCLSMRSSAHPLSSGLGCGMKPCCTALLYLPGLENQETKEPFLYRWPTLKYSVTAIESRAGHLDEEPPLSPS